jgi:hypothetical protein
MRYVQYEFLIYGMYVRAHRQPTVARVNTAHGPEHVCMQASKARKRWHMLFNPQSIIQAFEWVHLK